MLIGFFFSPTGTGRLTCPSGQAATQARHRVAAVGVGAVAPFLAAQPVGAILPRKKKRKEVRSGRQLEEPADARGHAN